MHMDQSTKRLIHTEVCVHEKAIMEILSGILFAEVQYVIDIFL